MSKEQRVAEGFRILDELKSIEAELEHGDVLPTDEQERTLVARYETLNRLYRREYLMLMRETL